MSINNLVDKDISGSVVQDTAGNDTAPVTGKSSFKLGHRPELDGVRGIAVIAVLCVHAHLLKGGFLGVDIFFVLSGFLITCLLLQEWDRTGNISLGRFYMRRALRLIPALVLMCLVVGLYAILFQSGNDKALTLKGLFWGLTYMGNWGPIMMGYQPPGLGHLWSLAVEEHYYLIWPLLILLILKYNNRSLASGIVWALIIISASWRFYIWHNSSQDEVAILRCFTGSDTRADSLLFGCAAALYVLNIKYISSKLMDIIALAAIASMVALLFFLIAADEKPFFIQGGYSLVAALTAIMIIGLVINPPVWMQRMFSNPILIWCGRLSYGLYLWHFPVQVLFFGHVAKPLGHFVIIAFSLIIPAISFYFFEQPFLRMKTRYSVK